MGGRSKVITVDIIQKILQTPILKVLSFYGHNLHYSRGNRAKIICPFHHETEPSFTVYLESNNAYCFGCGQYWDGVKIIQKKEANCKFFLALHILARIGGFEVSYKDLKFVYESSHKRLQEGRSIGEQKVYKRLLMRISSEFSAYVKSFSDYKKFDHIIEECWREFGEISEGKATRWKLDRAKNWLLRSKQIIREAARHWAKLPVLIDEVWRDQVE